MYSSLRPFPYFNCVSNQDKSLFSKQERVNIKEFHQNGIFFYVLMFSQSILSIQIQFELLVPELHPVDWIDRNRI